MTDRFLPHDWFPRALPTNVEIGERSWLYSSFSLVHCCSRRPKAVHIGHDSGLYNGTFFDLGPEGEIEIGDYCTIVGAIFATNGRVEVGDYSFIAHEVVITDHFVAVPPPGESPHPAAHVKTHRRERVDWCSRGADWQYRDRRRRDYRNRRRRRQRRTPLYNLWR